MSSLWSAILKPTSRSRSRQASHEPRQRSLNEPQKRLTEPPNKEPCIWWSKVRRRRAGKDSARSESQATLALDLSISGIYNTDHRNYDYNPYDFLQDYVADQDLRLINLHSRSGMPTTNRNIKTMYPAETLQSLKFDSSQGHSSDSGFLELVGDRSLLPQPHPAKTATTHNKDSGKDTVCIGELDATGIITASIPYLSSTQQEAYLPVRLVRDAISAGETIRVITPVKRGTRGETFGGDHICVVEQMVASVLCPLMAKGIIRMRGTIGWPGANYPYLRILMFTPRENVEAIAQLLSTANLYLDHPQVPYDPSEYPGDPEYFNPHYPHPEDAGIPVIRPRPMGPRWREEATPTRNSDTRRSHLYSSDIGAGASAKKESASFSSSVGTLGLSQYLNYPNNTPEHLTQQSYPLFSSPVLPSHYSKTTHSSLAELLRQRLSEICVHEVVCPICPIHIPGARKRLPGPSGLRNVVRFQLGNEREAALEYVEGASSGDNVGRIGRDTHTISPRTLSLGAKKASSGEPHRSYGIPNPTSTAPPGPAKHLPGPTAQCEEEPHHGPKGPSKLFTIDGHLKWSSTTPLTWLQALRLTDADADAVEIQKPVGGGGNCDMFLGIHLPSKILLSLKRPRLFEYEHEAANATRRFLREAKIWSTFNHSNILPFIGALQKNNELYLVSQWMERGDLSRVLRYWLDYVEEINGPQVCHPDHMFYSSLSERRFVHEIASGISYLHKQNCVHGDVKSANALLAEDGRVLLCDFGLTKGLDGSWAATSTAMKGTGSRRWQSPELFLNEPKSMKSDVYAFGMTIVEILTRIHPFPALSDTAVIFAVFNGERPPFNPKSRVGTNFQPFWELAAQCWQARPEDRPSMTEIISTLNVIAPD